MRHSFSCNGKEIDVDAVLASDDYSEIRQWLTTHIHQYGASKTKSIDSGCDRRTVKSAIFIGLSAEGLFFCLSNPLMSKPFVHSKGFFSSLKTARETS